MPAIKMAYMMAYEAAFAVIEASEIYILGSNKTSMFRRHSCTTVD
jgi:hypothetical protein